MAPPAAAKPAKAPKPFGLKEAYLVLYNLACAAGWAYVLYLAAARVASAGTAAPAAALATVWAAVRDPLTIVQWAMCMEVLHAAAGLVPSPVFTTFLQVLSRIVVLLATTYAPGSQSACGAPLRRRPSLAHPAHISHARLPDPPPPPPPLPSPPPFLLDTWHAGLMIFAWSFVEVPRYAFYVSALLQEATPFPLFWLRYSLFMVLYPAGITGEWFTLRAAAPALGATRVAGVPLDARAAVTALLYVYFAAGPFMIANMWFNRVGAFKKRFAKPPPPEVGVVFPEDGKGGRTTTITSQRAIAAAIKGCGGEEAAAAAAAAARDKNWKFNYPRHYRAMVRLGAASRAAAAGSAQAGLDWCHANFQFVSAPHAAPEGFAAGTSPKASRRDFGTGEWRGSGAPPAAFAVPYNGGWAPGMPLDVPAGARLSGEALGAQLEAWVKGGFMERDAAEAVKWTSALFAPGGGAAERLKRTHFVMIGAGSAMGPFKKLMELGAHVVALDVNFPTFSPWPRLLDTVSASPGRVTFPTSAPVAPAAAKDVKALAALAGCNVIEQPAEIGKWLVDWAAGLPAGDRVVIGNYTYLDGDRHVKLSLACDAIISALRRARPSTAIAFLCTPTDVHVATPEVVAASRAALGAGLGSLGLELAARALSGGQVLVPNALPPVPGPEGTQVHIVDGLVTAQSFNYALAKRIQHWRAAVEYEAGAIVSSMVAPSTATISVIHNKTFAWGYGGMPYFGYEVFKQDTTNAVMTAILLNDVLNEASPKNPANRKAAKIGSALELFRTEAVHGCVVGWGGGGPCSRALGGWN